MSSENKQDTSTILKNFFIKNFGQIDNQNIVDLNNFNKNSGNSFFNDTNEEDRNKMMKKIIDKINSLDDSIRLAFDMHRNGYNYNEIAVCFNIPLETVEERVRYARRVVREAILENYSDYHSLHSLTA